MPATSLATERALTRCTAYNRAEAEVPEGRWTLALQGAREASAAARPPYLVREA